MNRLFRERIQSIDILRGIIMLIMLLEHIRESWSHTDFNPLNLNYTSPEIFLTRWVSHFGMPLFIFLSGVSIYLTAQRKAMSRKELAKFLLVRGLIILCVDVLFLSNAFFVYKSKVYHFFFFFLQAMWVIGFSMILFSLLQFIKPKILLLLSITVIVLHNLIPVLHFDKSPFFSLLWNFFHQPGLVIFHKNLIIYVLYPLVPLLFVMTLGFSMGKIFEISSQKRKKILFITGFVLIGLFILIRYFTHFGDPEIWKKYPSLLKNILSFINCEKYPASFLYLMMTLGPGFIVLGLLEKIRLRENHPLLVFGRTAMFFYVIHYSLIIIGSILTGLVIYHFDFTLAIKNIPFQYGLKVTYFLWLIFIPVLYYFCRKYYTLKMNGGNAWMKYF